MQLTSSQQQCLDVSKSLFVTANAGSGKTRVLIERIAKVLVESDTEIHDIVAITYTRKAAAEMQSRLKNKLYDLASNDASPKVRERVHRAIRDFHKNRISTIHSFCRRLLQEYPAEAQVPVDFGDLSSVDESVLVEQAIVSVLAKEASSNPQQLFAILESFELQEVIQHTTELLTRHEEVFTNIEAQTQVSIEQRLHVVLEKAIHECIVPFLSRVLPGAKIAATDTKSKAKAMQQLKQSVSAVEEFLDLCKLNEDIHVLLDEKLLSQVAVFCGAITTTSNTIKKTPKPIAEHIAEQDIELVKTCKNMVGLLHRDVVETQTQEIRLLDYLIKLTAQMREEVDQKKQSLNVLTFHDLQEKCVDLLTIPEIRKKVRAEISCLFVDEVQDINFIQYRILKALTAGFPDENNPICFLVGDPKQSIYGFRHADVRLFARLYDDLKETRNDSEDFQRITLQETFRLPTNVGTFVNTVSASEFNSTSTEWDVEFEPFDCRKEEAGEVHLLVTRTYSSDDGSVSETQVAAHHVQKLWTESRDKNRSIAVLCRRKEPLRELAHILKHAGVPTHVSDSGGFYSSSLVGDLHQLLELLASPKNRVALFSVLHSPLCGVSDEELLHLMRISDFDIQRTEEWKNLGLSSHMADCLAKLHCCINTTRGVPAQRALELCSDILGWQHQPRQATEYASFASDYHQLLEVAAAAESTYNSSIAQFCGLLRSRIHAKEQHSSEESVDHSVVQLMTIHASKGLEFDTVLLLESQGTTALSDRLLVHPSLGIACKSAINSTSNDEKSPSPLYELIRKNEREKQRAEDKRLHYVASTRAERQLIVSGAISNDKPPNKYFGFVCSCNDEMDTLLQKPVQTFTSDGRSCVANTHSFGAESLVEHSDSLPSIPTIKGIVRRSFTLDKQVAQVGQTFSASQLLRFKQDPEQWLAEYVVGAEFAAPMSNTISNDHTTASSQELFVGSDKGNVVHKGLEEINAWLTVNSEGKQVTSIDRQALLASVESTPNITASQQLFQVASDYIEQLVRSHEFFFADVALHGESEVQFMLPFGQDFIAGSFDILLPFGNDMRVYDWKTNSLGELNSVEHLGQHYALQLELYLIALADLYPNQQSWTTGLISTESLLNTADFELSVFETTVSRSELASYRAKIQAILLEMKHMLALARHFGT